MIYKFTLDKIGLGCIHCECDCVDRLDLYKHITEYGFKGCDQIILTQEGDNILNEEISITEYDGINTLIAILNREENIVEKVKQNAPYPEDPLENPCKDCKLFTTKLKIGCNYKPYCTSWQRFDDEYSKQYEPY